MSIEALDEPFAKLMEKNPSIEQIKVLHNGIYWYYTRKEPKGKVLNWDVTAIKVAEGIWRYTF